MKTKRYLIGIENNIVCDYNTTLRQIKIVKRFECSFTTEAWQKIDWNTFDNPICERSLFQSILRDRKRRVDEKIAMADRMPFAVITVKKLDEKVIRVEFYEGHDELKLTYDFRDVWYKSIDMPNFMNKDVMKYNPSMFLYRNYGIPLEYSKVLLEGLHETETAMEHSECEGCKKIKADTPLCQCLGKSLEEHSITLSEYENFIFNKIS